jgi:hypothetical protein
MEGEIVGRKKRLLEGGKDSLKSDSAAETTEKMVVVGEIVGAVIEKKFLEESETETETVTVATADGESVEISSSELKLTGAPGPQPPSLLPANTPENHRKYFDFGLNAFGNHEGPDDCNYVALTDEQAEAADAEGNPNKRKLWMLGYSQGLVNEGFMAGKYGKAIDTNPYVELDDDERAAKKLDMAGEWRTGWNFGYNLAFCDKPQAETTVADPVAPTPETSTVVVDKIPEPSTNGKHTPAVHRDTALLP